MSCVQVIYYKPIASRSPFGVVDGYVAQPDNPFSDTTNVKVDSDDDDDDIFGDEPDISAVTEEPKKKVVKKKSAPAPADDTGLSAVIDEWDD